MQGTIDLLVGPHALQVLYSPLRIRLLLDEFDHDEGPTLVGGPEIRRDRRSLVELERPVFESRGTDSGLYDRTTSGVFRGVPLTRSTGLWAVLRDIWRRRLRRFLDPPQPLKRRMAAKTRSAGSDLGPRTTPPKLFSLIPSSPAPDDPTTSVLGRSLRRRLSPMQLIVAVKPPQ